MYKVKFNIDDQSLVLQALCYIGHNLEALKEIKEVLLDTEVSFCSNELDSAFKLLVSCSENIVPLEDMSIIQDLLEIKIYSSIEQGSDLHLSKVYFKHFLERLKQNTESIETEPLINYKDYKDAFKAFIQSNLRAIINSVDENKFAYWNGQVWGLLTIEETKVLYGDFLKKCRANIIKLHSIERDDSLEKLKERVIKWDADNKCNECINSVRRDRDRIINMKYHQRNDKLICTSDGKVIDLSTGQIRQANKRDLILHTVKYKLINKIEADEFMNEIFKMYEFTLGSIERLNFLNDFIAYKFLGNSMQKAIFNIGRAGTGKSFFKNIINDLFISEAVNIPYAYFTTKHKGNGDVSRDDILVSLNNKKIGLASEPEKGELISQARFKNILSSSSEKARETKGTLIDVNLKKLDLVIDTNDIPIFTEFNEAINRRLIFVRWINPVPEEKIDANFYSTIVSPNFDYVFSYYVYRALDLINKKLKIPDIVITDTINNTRKLDSFVRFINMYLEPTELDSYIEVNELYNLYDDFCKQECLISSIPENMIKNEKVAKGYLIKRLCEMKEFQNINPVRITKHKTYIIKGVNLKKNNKHNENQSSNILSAV